MGARADNQRLVDNAGALKGLVTHSETSCRATTGLLARSRHALSYTQTFGHSPDFMTEFRAAHGQQHYHYIELSLSINILTENHIRISGACSQLQRGHSQLNRPIRNNCECISNKPGRNTPRPPLACGYRVMTLRSAKGGVSCSGHYIAGDSSCPTAGRRSMSSRPF